MSGGQVSECYCKDKMVYRDNIALQKLFKIRSTFWLWPVPKSGVFLLFLSLISCNRWLTTFPSWPASAQTCGLSPCAPSMDRGTTEMLIHGPLTLAAVMIPHHMQFNFPFRPKPFWQANISFSLRHTVGDTKVPFCLQSCVKPLKYAIAVHDHGTEYVHRFIGKEPSGLRFNKLFLNEEGEETISPHTHQPISICIQLWLNLLSMHWLKEDPSQGLVAMEL